MVNKIIFSWYQDVSILLGAYIYMETSSPRHKGERAVLSSGIQPATLASGQCLSFWYHMFGAHVSTLNVYLKTQTGNQTMIWSRSRTQGNVWKNGLRTVKSTVPFEILFEGIVGYSWQGDIALDDISLNQGACPPASKYLRFLGSKKVYVFLFFFHQSLT